VKFCSEVRHRVRGRGRDPGNVLAEYSKPWNVCFQEDLYKGRERLEKSERWSHRAEWRGFFLQQEVMAIGRPPEHGQGYRTYRPEGAELCIRMNSKPRDILYTVYFS
jgi:hypothetical protein